MTKDSKKEAILEAAKLSAQAHGYGGLNYRDLANAVGIKAASIYHHFASKADLGAAVARRYWEDAKARLDTLTESGPDPRHLLGQYPSVFRGALETGNRICLASFMTAELDDLPPVVQHEVRQFAEVNVAWLDKTLVAAGVTGPEDSETRARAIFAAVAGAQLLAKSRSDVALYDTLIDTYKRAGLLPA